MTSMEQILEGFLWLLQTHGLHFVRGSCALRQAVKGTEPGWGHVRIPENLFPMLLTESGPKFQSLLHGYCNYCCCDGGTFQNSQHLCCAEGCIVR